VKCKVVLGMLALIGTLALSATAAQAGSGGLPSALTSFFACYSITNTKDSGQTVDFENDQQIESPIGVPDRKGVRIGSGSLACTIIRMLVPSKATQQFLAEPNPNHPDEEGFNGIKCYSVTGPGGSLFPGPSGTFSFTDTIWGNLGTLIDIPVPGSSPPTTEPGPFPGSLDTEKGIVVSQLRYICGPAKITQP
jgi:hypothetical protein